MNNYQLTKIKQHFHNNSLTDIKGVLAVELLNLQHLIKPGARLAIAVGSRGIKNLPLVVKEVVDFLKANHALPFIIPAMGSHGDATAQGQTGILESYGISENTMGVPVVSSMEVVELEQGDSPVRIFMDKSASESDGVIMIGRIKLHTDFHGKYESGLVKMSVIGLGKERQASAIHSYGVYGLFTLIPVVAKHVFSTGKILGGIGLVENAYDETMLIKALRVEEIFEQEPLMLDIARKNMASLPVDELDVLIIDKMGKDISGAGIDTNIIGRIKINGQKEPDNPSIKAIIISDLTDESHGNATGVGLGDVISRKLYNKIDFSSTYKNAITSSFLERAKIPVVADNDKVALEVAFRSCGYIKEGEEKIIRIKDTLHLDEIYVSQAVLDSIEDRSQIEIVQENKDLFQGENEFASF
jgi:hypothetical protein